MFCLCLSFCLWVGLSTGSDHVHFRQMGPECVSFVTAVRELWAREMMTSTSKAVGGAAGTAGGPRVRVKKDGKTRVKHLID